MSKALEGVSADAESVGHERQREQIRRSTGTAFGEEEMDQEARDRADEAMGRVTTHEAICSERWKNNNASLARIESSLKWSIGLAPAGAITALASLCAFMAERAFHI